MEKLGDFSKVVRQYSKARRGVPPAVIEYVTSLIGAKSPFVLDLGCGTGISTRQLKEVGVQVVGADKYQDMVLEAKKVSRGIEYVVAPAEKLPFPDGTFDAVTAFSAFHWFANMDAGKEIRRVLKPGKFLITVNREEKDNFKRQAMNMMREKLAPKREDKDILEGMKNSGFEDLTERRFESTEEYSPEEAMEFLRSSAWWKIIPPDLEQEISDACREIIAVNQTAKGTLVRDLNFLVISGR